MKINSLKELEKLVKLCRKQGIQTITVDGITMQLGNLPSKPQQAPDFSADIPEANIQIPLYTPVASTTDVQEYADKIATDELTPEQLLMYSVADHTQPEAQ